MCIMLGAKCSQLSTVKGTSILSPTTHFNWYLPSYFEVFYNKKQLKCVLMSVHLHVFHIRQSETHLMQGSNNFPNAYGQEVACSSILLTQDLL